MSDELTAEDIEALENSGYGSLPEKEDKQSILSFFNKVIGMTDNTKTGNVSIDELGEVKLPIRTNLELHNYCSTMGMKGLSDYFIRRAQIISGSSLSKDGFLDQLIVTQKKESEIKRKTSSTAQKKNWFKPKGNLGGQQDATN